MHRNNCGQGVAIVTTALKRMTWKIIVCAWSFPAWATSLPPAHALTAKDPLGKNFVKRKWLLTSRQTLTVGLWIKTVSVSWLVRFEFCSGIWSSQLFKRRMWKLSFSEYLLPLACYKAAFGEKSISGAGKWIPSGGTLAFLSDRWETPPNVTKQLWVPSGKVHFWLTLVRADQGNI